ncbi:MAG: ribulokinase [Rhizomicrobium sp.]|nr:ribulokinase [Rhizomicrobium sp.]
MDNRYAIGLDYGTNSVRALIVDVADGREIAAAIWTYAHGHQGVVLGKDPNLARQHPADYLTGAERTMVEALAIAAEAVPGFAASQVIGIGVDTTGSTPMPVDADGVPLALDPKWSENPNALAWLWKDHTGWAEAAEITKLASQMRPQYLAKIGGVYSSEWFYSKILHCLRTAPEVFDAAYSWIELADFVPAALSATLAPGKFVAGICAAGHKAMYNKTWGGYPDKEFLNALDPKLAALRDHLTPRVQDVSSAVGGLSSEWAAKTGLPAGIPIAVGAFDCHLGAIGAGVKPGVLVKIIGTSTCDITVKANSDTLADVPGVCGVVDGSVLPGYFGLEAGQSAVGDIFNWFVEYVKPAGLGHVELTTEADKLKPGESGLMALDWNNGNRTVLVDQRLTGLLLGQTLYTTPAEIYRALVEATAFGALTIINRFEEYGVTIDEVINCGGIAEKNAFIMQLYADVTGRPMKVSRSAQTPALGSAIAASVVAGVYADFAAAQAAMTGLKDRVYQPDGAAHAVYAKLYTIYRTLHDAFGTTTGTTNLATVMKQLIDIREQARG